MKKYKEKLNAQLAAINERVAALEQERAHEERVWKLSFTTAQLCELVGISRYRLQKAYEEYGIPIPPPYRREGKHPTYTMEDVKTCIEYLKNAEVEL